MNKSNKTCFIYGVKEKYIPLDYGNICSLKYIIDDSIAKLIRDFNYKSFIFILDYNTSFFFFDQLIIYREIVTDIKITIIKPQKFNFKLLSKDERDKIDTMLKKADITILVSNKNYQQEMHSAINAGIHYSNCLMCIWDLGAGNTSYALSRFQYFNKPIICINSNDNKYFDYSRSNFLIKNK